MSEAELKLVTDAKNCTMYTIQFLSDDDSEFEKFYAKFRNELEYNEDFERLLNILGRIADFGALERFFRPEGKMNDRVCALPVLKSKLRLYCLRLSDKILILGNGEELRRPEHTMKTMPSKDMSSHSRTLTD